MCAMRAGLFDGLALPDEAKRRSQEARRQIERTDADTLLARGEEILLSEVLELFEPATLIWDAPTSSEPVETVQRHETQFGGMVRQRLATLVVRIPVTGDPRQLTYTSHRGAPGPWGNRPDAVVTDTHLELKWEGSLDSDPEGLSTWLQGQRRWVEQFLINNNADVSGLNDEMRTSVVSLIRERVKAELARRHLSATLPFPLERTPDATPITRVRRTTISIATVGKQEPFRPEPALEDAQYEEILTDCAAFGRVFERTPAIEKMDEEEIRNLARSDVHESRRCRRALGEAGGATPGTWRGICGTSRISTRI